MNLPELALKKTNICCILKFYCNHSMTYREQIGCLGSKIISDRSKV